MSPWLLMLLVFLAIVLAVFGAYSILSDVFLRARRRLSKRVDEEFRKRQRERARRSLLFKDPGAPLPDLPAEQEERTSVRKWFQTTIEQSGLDVAPRRLLLIMAGVGVAAALLGMVLTWNVLVAAAVGLVGAAAPFLYV